MIYVVGSEQIQHFKSLFFVAEKLGLSKNKKLIHLSHGMVNLVDGKMKSREGNVIDADNLISNLIELIIPEMTQKIENKESAKKNALNIALGAIHYYLLKSAIHKDIVFNKKKACLLQEILDHISNMLEQELTAFLKNIKHFLFL